MKTHATTPLRPPSSVSIPLWRTLCGLIMEHGGDPSPTCKKCERIIELDRERFEGRKP